MENKSFDGQYGDQVGVSSQAALAFEQGADGFDMSNMASYNYSAETIQRFNQYKESNPELFGDQNSLSNSQEQAILELIEQNKADLLIAEYHLLLIEQNQLGIDAINLEAQEAQAKFAGDDDKAIQYGTELSTKQADLDTKKAEASAKYQEVLNSGN